MHINIDSREKPRAITRILEEFDRHGIEYITNKMYVGDYCYLENPLFIIDRKQNIGEIAQNATSGHDRFKRELIRLDEMGARMVVLVEQNRYKDIRGEWQTVKSVEDLMFWQNPHGVVDGVRIYKILSTWEHKHNVTFRFCRKDQTGKKIIELLDWGVEHVKNC